MSAPVAASLYESLAGAYWAVANHEKAIAERCRESGSASLAMTHQAASAEAERKAREAETSAKYLWEAA